MNKKIFLKIILAWFLLMILAIANGSLRTFVYGKYISDLLAHQISTIIFITIIFLVVYLFLKKDLKTLSNKNLIYIGLIWLVFTESFEFLAGHYLFHNSWEKLFADYNIFAGRVWVFVLLATIFSPYLLSKVLKNK